MSPSFLVVLFLVVGFAMWLRSADRDHRERRDRRGLDSRQSRGHLPAAQRPQPQPGPRSPAPSPWVGQRQQPAHTPPQRPRHDPGVQAERARIAAGLNELLYLRATELVYATQQVTDGRATLIDVGEPTSTSSAWRLDFSDGTALLAEDLTPGGLAALAGVAARGTLVAGSWRTDPEHSGALLQLDDPDLGSLEVQIVGVPGDR